MMDWVVGRFEGLPEISHSILIPPGTSRNELANQFALVRNCLGRVRKFLDELKKIWHEFLA